LLENFQAAIEFVLRVGQGVAEAQPRQMEVGGVRPAPAIAFRDVADQIADILALVGGRGIEEVGRPIERTIECLEVLLRQVVPRDVGCDEMALRQDVGAKFLGERHIRLHDHRGRHFASQNRVKPRCRSAEMLQLDALAADKALQQPNGGKVRAGEKIDADRNAGELRRAIDRRIRRDDDRVQRPARLQTGDARLVALDRLFAEIVGAADVALFASAEQLDLAILKRRVTDDRIHQSGIFAAVFRRAFLRRRDEFEIEAFIGKEALIAGHVPRQTVDRRTHLVDDFLQRHCSSPLLRGPELR
jgi:hypothetical protein